ncbi:MAG: methionyl-tRNA formyltransferase [Candidatus Levybacteria bacterium]|nr:methionyl-tRNA formyltransferase [Candidatus Levybacteria bacterium]
MNIIFFGNTKYSVIVAEKLHKNFGLKAVVTIPDSPVKAFALKNNIRVVESRRLDNNTVKQIAHFSPDFLVVADYGLLLPKELLNLPKYAPLNVHHSLLPKYRGPSPVPTAILNGEKISGVTIIKMNEVLDAGDILAQKEYTLKPDETTPNLLTKLNELGGEIIISVINDYIAGYAKPIPQNENDVTFTKRFEKKDGYIDLKNPPEQLDRMIRAFYPWPGVWTRQMINGKSSIIKFLPLQKIQVEGKKPMSYKDFINGYQQLLEEPAFLP